MYKTLKKFLRPLFSQSMKNGAHFLEALGANIYFGFPGRSMKIIGVTGTNGKTTTTQMIGAILRKAGKKVAVASTIDYWVDTVHEVNSTKFTTTSAWQLQKFLQRARKAGCEYVVLETSSHALDQNRVWGITYDVAVITNVTREHLDYHKTMEEYRKAKQKLFRGGVSRVVNLDMVKPEDFIGNDSKSITYSTKNKEATLFAGGIQLDFAKTEFRIGEEKYSLSIPGLFNIENALAAIGVAKIYSIEEDVIREALLELRGVPGRMELVTNPQQIDIIIDYAVTPDAFTKLYASVLPLKIPGTKIIHVFGACGDRDRGKRPILGEIAAKAADIVILTNEDPYTEDGEKIISEIELGVERFKKKTKNYFRLYDRREAIAKALSLAEIGDIVLVTGKGAETNMAIGEERIPWNDRQVIEEELQHIA